MEQLTLPISGQISHIIHFSDLHIRNGDTERSRFNDFKEVINNFEKILTQLPCVIQKTAVCVFTGDMFDMKGRLDSCSVLLYNMLINTITTLTPLYIIHGNHDFMQSNTEIPDVLYSLLYRNTNHNINYLNKTGHYLAGNVGFGFVDIKDTLKHGAGSGHVENLPDFPDPSLFPPTVTTTIALYHGPFKNAILQTNLINTEGLPIDWIKSKKYNCAMLGDIHLCQFMPSNDWNSQFIWCYAGSTIQGNFGENYDGHGFLLWDLEQKNVKHYEIPCPSKFLNITLENEQLICHLSRKNKLTIDQFLERINLPHHVYIKLKGYIPPSKIDQLQIQLQRFKITHSIVRGLIVNPIEPISSHDESHHSSQSHVDLTQYNTPTMWTQYIEQSDHEKVLGNCEWHMWLQNPRTLLLSNMSLNHPNLTETIKSRDKDISVIIDKLENNLSQIQAVKKDSFTIRYMTWDYILCYGKDNIFNFNQMDNKICVINGTNSSGKSSFLETIMIGLYGDDFPSRKDRLGLSSIICHKKPNNEVSQTRIIFSLGQQYYQIHRIFEITNGKKNTLTTKKISLSQINPETLKEPKIIASLSTSVKFINDWVNEHIGPADNFMMSCLVTQLSDADFFSLKDQDQIKLLDDVLHITTINDISAVIKSVSLGLDALEKQCTTLRNYCAHEHQDELINFSHIEQLKESIDRNKNQLEDLKLQATQIVENWHDLDTNDLMLDTPVITEKITNLQQSINKLNINDIDQHQLLLEKALIDQKITELGSCQLLKLTIDQAKTELIELNKCNVPKPSCTQDFYQQHLDQINTWRKVNHNQLSESLEVIKDKIIECNELGKKYDHQLQDLITHKPNQPEINLEQYNDFLIMFKKIQQSIIELPEPYNKIQYLEKYCLEHPLSSSTFDKDQLTQLKSQYQQEIDHVIDQTKIVLKIDQLKEELIEKEKNKEILLNKLEKIHDQMTEYDNKLDQLTKEIETITDQINDVGELVKPRKTLVEVTEWIRKFNLKKDKYEQNESCLKSLTIQHTILTQKFDKNKELLRQLEIVASEITQIEHQDIPFNPNCEACCRQPWKIRHQQLLVQKEQLTAQMDHSINDDDLRHIKEKIDLLTRWMNDYTRYQKILPEYQNMERNWIIYEKNHNILNHYREEKNQKLQMLGDVKKIMKSHTDERKRLEFNKDQTQCIINDLSYIINHQPNWELMKEKIDNIIQYQKDVHIHIVFKQYIKLNVNYHKQQKSLIKSLDQWTKSMENIKTKIKQNDTLLDQLKQTITILDQDAHYSQTEKDYLTQINQWINYQYHQQHLSALQMIIYQDQLSQIDQQLTLIKSREETKNQLQYWKKVDQQHDNFLKKHDLTTQITNLSQVIQDTIIQYEKDKHLYELDLKKKEEIKIYDTLLSQITNKQQKLNFIHKLLANYRNWLYSEIVIPKIVATINQIVVGVTQCNDYSLNANISIDRFDKLNINWSINSPSGLASLNKAGGFRRYIYGLIMRISLSRMGCNINNTQLCIDEGFTSADSINLEKMQQFISNLIDFYHNGIILASHLQIIKECADIIVEIQKNHDMTSLIQFNSQALVLTDTQTEKKVINKVKLVLSNAKKNQTNIDDRQCIATQKNGKRCTRNAKFGQYCGIHTNINQLTHLHDKLSQ